MSFEMDAGTRRSSELHEALSRYICPPRNRAESGRHRSEKPSSCQIAHSSPDRTSVIFGLPQVFPRIESHILGGSKWFTNKGEGGGESPVVHSGRSSGLVLHPATRRVMRRG